MRSSDAHLNPQLAPLARRRVLNRHHQLGLVRAHVARGFQRLQELDNSAAVRLGRLVRAQFAVVLEIE